MTDLTCILQELDGADADASHRLLPLVYSELRRVAASKMARESASSLNLPAVTLALNRPSARSGRSTHAEPAAHSGHFSRA